MKRIPNKFLRRTLLVLFVTAMSTACVQRPLNDYDRAAILGAAEAQEMQNARDAVKDVDNHRDRSHNLRHQHKRDW